MRLTVPQKLYEFDWSSEWEGKRLKDVIRMCMPELSSRALVMVVANGLVHQGEAVVGDLDARLEPGIQVTIDLRHGVRGEQKPKKPRLDEQIRVLHDDAALVVVSKAAGIVVQPTAEEKAGSRPPVVELLKHYWKAKGQQAVNPILVQRLDKETSGLMVLGKTVPAARILQKQAAGRTMERRYIALVHGVVRENKGTWKSLLGIGEGGLRQAVGEVPEDPEAKLPAGAHPAITHWHVTERFAHHTLLELQLETGRTHQIRIHCAEAGHPVVGDNVYVKVTYMRQAFRRRAIESQPPAPRMMLHAVRLKFQHPEKASHWLTFRDELPQDMADFIETTRRAASPSERNAPGAGEAPRKRPS